MNKICTVAGTTPATKKVFEALILSYFKLIGYWF